VWPDGAGSLCASASEVAERIADAKSIVLETV
jgi:hypothetical protein